MCADLHTGRFFVHLMGKNEVLKWPQSKCLSQENTTKTTPSRRYCGIRLNSSSVKYPQILYDIKLYTNLKNRFFTSAPTFGRENRDFRRTQKWQKWGQNRLFRAKMAETFPHRTNFEAKSRFYLQYFGENSPRFSFYVPRFFFYVPRKFFYAASRNS